jgi:hypothetical protein
MGKMFGLLGGQLVVVQFVLDPVGV